MNRYRIKWSVRAENDLADIHDYISERSYASVATKVADDIVAATDILSFSPHFAKVDKFGLAKLGYRKRTVGSYIIFFLINETEKIVTIETIMHGARNWQSHLK